MDPDSRAAGSAKTSTTKFSLMVDGRRIAVCKVGFMDIFKISKHRVATVIKKMKNGDMSLKDQRGKHSKTKIASESREKVKNHISSFPTVESHYGRHNGQNSLKYLEPGMNLEKMYELYIEECRQQNDPEVEVWLYRDVFRKEFKLSFSTPKEDTCDQCDRLMALMTNENDPIRKANLKHERDEHVQQSEC